jgi:hypothetical protein
MSQESCATEVASPETIGLERLLYIGPTCQASDLNLTSVCKPIHIIGPEISREYAIHCDIRTCSQN